MALDKQLKELTEKTAQQGTLNNKAIENAKKTIAATQQAAKTLREQKAR